jgi:hypothetical protein
MTAAAVDFHRTPTAMTELPNVAGIADLPADLAELRTVVQGLLLHRDWAPAYGVEGAAIRSEEQHLRSSREVLERAVALVDAPVTQPRAPVDRVLTICRHLTLLHTAFLRHHGIPARVRCGFGGCFEDGRVVDVHLDL